MEQSRACKIARQINRDTIPKSVKIDALRTIVKLPTLRNVTKANLIAVVEWLIEETQPAWMPYDEGNPACDEEVFVTDGQYIWIDELQSDGEMYWWDNMNIDPYLTAWMPMPELWEP